MGNENGKPADNQKPKKVNNSPGTIKKRPDQQEKPKESKNQNAGFQWPDHFDVYNPFENLELDLFGESPPPPPAPSKVPDSIVKNKKSKQKKKDQKDEKGIHEKDANKEPDKKSRMTFKSLGSKYIGQILEAGIVSLVKEFEALKKYVPEDMSIEVFKANPSLNRYHDVPCLDATRVQLDPYVNKDGYIHANYVRLQPIAPPRYICTQGPKDNTVTDFWEMVVKNKTKCIMMLCQCFELNKAKCAEYYPSQPQQHLTFSPPNSEVKIVVKNTGKVKETDPMPEGTFIHNLEVQTSSGKHNLVHVQWTEWPDHTAPDVTQTVYQLISLVHKHSGGVAPIIHCSAGIGRTGTFVALDFIKDYFKTYDGKAKIADLVKHLRNQRFMSIQTAPQYVFLHLAVIDVVLKSENLSESLKVRKFRKNFVTYQEKIKQEQMKGQKGAPTKHRQASASPSPPLGKVPKSPKLSRVSPMLAPTPSPQPSPIPPPNQNFAGGPLQNQPQNAMKTVGTPPENPDLDPHFALNKPTTPKRRNKNGSDGTVEQPVQHAQSTGGNKCSIKPRAKTPNKRTSSKNP